ncbi:hypothetical protein PanWU01x14_090570, partial [Parasponia andersonii]
SVLLLNLLVDGDQISNPRSSYICSCSWLIRRVGTKLYPTLENDQEHLLDPLEHRDVRWDCEIARNFFSPLFSALANFSLPPCVYACSTPSVTVQFFLSYILYIWDPKLLTLVQLGLGLFSNLGFGCIFINMSNS